MSLCVILVHCHFVILLSSHFVTRSFYCLVILRFICLVTLPLGHSIVLLLFVISLYSHFVSFFLNLSFPSLQHFSALAVFYIFTFPINDILAYWHFELWHFCSIKFCQSDIMSVFYFGHVTFWHDNVSALCHFGISAYDHFVFFVTCPC